jgi:D-beta-D-heptose 7-phosphate kinase/D-beta-D-heptose 1-phosphate adenosyltransferase
VTIRNFPVGLRASIRRPTIAGLKLINPTLYHKTMLSIALSGGFDPIHIGHIRMIQEAAERWDKVIVILNSDAWLTRKKGFVFMPWEQRREIIQAIKGVDFVTGVDDEDGTVCSALRILRPDYFGNGGDRTYQNTPELILCRELDIEPIWNLGGGKIQSSSELVQKTKISK